ncbi:hypothetical protein [Chlorogloea sp. CCALA 695]|uniref:hypothetical protein n=1 Tax=Chlorogloea sp. CCALA 695 TaxID=2107693 RepID=UPI0011B1F799|nr:hypothetical protein [Chlorogloea sp. CCALA 695]
MFPNVHPLGGIVGDTFVTEFEVFERSHPTYLINGFKSNRRSLILLLYKNLDHTNALQDESAIN